MVAVCVAVEWLGRKMIAVKITTSSKTKNTRVCIFQFSWQEALMISAADLIKAENQRLMVGAEERRACLCTPPVVKTTAVT
jgi:hypothetical protein